MSCSICYGHAPSCPYCDNRPELEMCCRCTDAPKYYYKGHKFCELHLERELNNDGLLDLPENQDSEFHEIKGVELYEE